MSINLSHSGHEPNINTLSIACDNVNPIVGPATTTQLMKKSQKRWRKEYQIQYYRNGVWYEHSPGRTRRSGRTFQSISHKWNDVNIFIVGYRQSLWTSFWTSLWISFLPQYRHTNLIFLLS